MLVKAPNDVLDYMWDWGTNGWLYTGDTIETVAWTLQSGITQALLEIPETLTVTPSTTGGTLAANTYYWAVTATLGGGETTKSNVVNATTTGTTSSAVLSWAADVNATGHTIYRTTDPAFATGVVRIGTVTGSTATFTDTGAAGTSASPPASNTAALVTNTNTTATVWIGGGTAGNTYTVTCQVTTEQGRIGQWTQNLTVENL